MLGRSNLESEYLARIFRRCAPRARRFTLSTLLNIHQARNALIYFRKIRSLSRVCFLEKSTTKYSEVGVFLKQRWICKITPKTFHNLECTIKKFCSSMRSSYISNFLRHSIPQSFGLLEYEKYRALKESIKIWSNTREVKCSLEKRRSFLSSLQGSS